MRNSLDFTSWSGTVTTLLGLILVSLVAVGIRLVFMQTLQRRRHGPGVRRSGPACGAAEASAGTRPHNGQ